MKKGNLFDLNLQYFAEGEESGANDEGIANLSEETTGEVDTEGVYDDDEPEGEVSEGEPEVETEQQDFKNEQNAAFANMRRKAEADAQAKVDARIAKLCQGYTHPVTGLPITTFAEYEDALYQQDRLATEKEMKDNGIDPSILDKVISNNPIIKEAQAVIANSQMQEAERRLQSELEEIKKLDPTIKTVADIPNMDQIVNMVKGGVTFLNAYKVANLDSVVNNAKASARQTAINQVRGKAHMTGIDSLADNNTDLEVPTAELSMYKEMFPNKSVEEIKKLYNTTIKKLGGK